MALPLSIITTKALQPATYAAYLKSFIDSESHIDWEFYDKFGEVKYLPSGLYGDGSAEGLASKSSTVGSNPTAYVAGNVYGSDINAFKVKIWDDLAYTLNWGSTEDGVNDSDYTSDGGLGYNFTNLEIQEKTAYASGTNNRAHDKAITSYFTVNLPVVRQGATQTYDNWTSVLIATEDMRMIVSQFGKIAKVGRQQYIRATLINEAPSVAVSATITSGVLQTAGKTALTNALNGAIKQFKKIGAKPFAPAINATDKVGTVPVKARYIVVINSQIEDVISQLDGFKSVIEYANQSGILENEFGAIPSMGVAFVTNDILVRQASGTYSSTITKVDVYNGTNFTTYNMLILAKEAYVTGELEGVEKYKMYMHEPIDTLRINKEMGFKSFVSARVVRSKRIINAVLTLTYN